MMGFTIVLSGFNIPSIAANINDLISSNKSVEVNSEKQLTISNGIVGILGNFIEIPPGKVILTVLELDVVETVASCASPHGIVLIISLASDVDLSGYVTTETFNQTINTINGQLANAITAQDVMTSDGSAKVVVNYTIPRDLYDSMVETDSSDQVIGG